MCFAIDATIIVAVSLPCDGPALVDQREPELTDMPAPARTTMDLHRSTVVHGSSLF